MQETKIRLYLMNSIIIYNYFIENLSSLAKQLNNYLDSKNLKVFVFARNKKNQKIEKNRYQAEKDAAIMLGVRQK